MRILYDVWLNDRKVARLELTTTEQCQAVNTVSEAEAAAAARAAAARAATSIRTANMKADFILQSACSHWVKAAKESEGL